MILHNNCINHDISGETEFVPEIEAIQDGQLIFSPVDNYPVNQLFKNIFIDICNKH